MVFQQNFSYIVAVSFIGGGNKSIWRKPPTCRKSQSNFITYCCIEYTSPWTGFELTTSVVIGTDCTGSWKSNYHTITSTMAPKLSFVLILVLLKLYYRILLLTRWMESNVPCIRKLKYKERRRVFIQCGLSSLIKSLQYDMKWWDTTLYLDLILTNIMLII